MLVGIVCVVCSPLLVSINITIARASHDKTLSTCRTPQHLLHTRRRTMSTHPRRVCRTRTRTRTLRPPRRPNTSRHRACPTTRVITERMPRRHSAVCSRQARCSALRRTRTHMCPLRRVCRTTIRYPKTSYFHLVFVSQYLFYVLPKLFQRLHLCVQLSLQNFQLYAKDFINLIIQNELFANVPLTLTFLCPFCQLILVVACDIKCAGQYVFPQPVVHASWW